jgi:restriction system protein
MAEVTRKRTGELVRKLFEILIPFPDGMKAHDSLSGLESKIELTEYEKGNYKSGSRRFEKIVRFATVDCVKAGWMLKAKGRWSITEEGKAAYTELTDPEAFFKRAVQLYYKWKSSRPDSEPTTQDEAEDEASGKTATITFEEAEEQSWEEIDAFLHDMQPYDFQDLVANLLKAMGYFVMWVSPPGKDAGIDILASTDPLGTKTPRIKVQVKRRTEAVNVEGLRSFMALLGEGDVGLFVSASGFTKDASEEARTQEKRKVTLIDLERLFDLWVENYSRLNDEARQLLPLKPVYYLAPEI